MHLFVRQHRLESVSRRGVVAVDLTAPDGRTQRIELQNGRNLLARNGVRIYGDAPSPRELVDGSAGIAGAAM